MRTELVDSQIEESQLREDPRGQEGRFHAFEETSMIFPNYPIDT